MDEIYANGSPEDKGGRVDSQIRGGKEIIACGRWRRIGGMVVIQGRKIEDCNHSQRISPQSLNSGAAIGAEKLHCSQISGVLEFF